MSGHKLVCDWQPNGTASFFSCAGCTWEVVTMAKPGQATAAAVQTAYDQHLNPEAGLDDVTRANTPDTFTTSTEPDGVARRTRHVTVKRSCDGCGESVGDATAAELEAAMCGHPLPSVAAEHGCQEGRTA